MSPLQYTSGEPILAGDIDTCAPDSGWPSRVVVQIETGDAVEGYTPENWSYLKVGFMVETEAVGIIHYEMADEDFELVRRAS